MELGEDEYNDIIEKKTTSIGQGINDAQKNNKEHTFLKANDHCSYPMKDA